MVKEKKLLILCVVTLISLSTSCLTINASDTDYSVGDHTGSIMFDGLERTYRIHIPFMYDTDKSMPLVIALHGFGGSGETMEKLSGFNILSDREAFIVVYPDAIKRCWNDGREVSKYRSNRRNIDDMGFISTLIDHLTKELNIDKKRIYVTGMSNGAIMSYRLACELPEKIAAIAPVAGTMREKVASQCSPSRAISVLVINNVDDPIVPWEGIELKNGTLISVPSTVRYWVTHNNCSSSPIITWEPDKDPQDGTRVRREVYGQGKEGTEVILYAIEGGGHTWPGGQPYLPERIIGKTSRDISACEVIWEFFKKHSIM